MGTLIPQIEADRVRLGLSKDTWALFKSDGHLSRYAFVALEALLRHKILLYLYPSHTSQCTQPLDLVIFGILKKALHKNLKELALKNAPDMMSNAAVHRCKAMEACLEALHVATSKSKTKAAFARGGVILHENKVIVDSSKFAEHLPNPEHVFDIPLEPPPRSALYSCVLNTPAIIQEVKTAKKENQDPQVAKDAWLKLAAIRDEITEAEIKFFHDHPDVLPWSSNPLIGKDPNLAFSPGTGSRRSIEPTKELQWYERLLEEFKEEVAKKTENISIF